MKSKYTSDIDDAIASAHAAINNLTLIAMNIKGA